MSKKIVSQNIISKGDERILNPYEYFNSIKSKVQTMDDNKLFDIYNNARYLATIYQKTGQKKGLKKLVFHMESIMKEQQVLDKGINKFVYKDDIEEYIQDVANKQVVIIDISQYERFIPETVVKAYEKVKDLFDEFYIVCTDYNGKMSKQVQKERREKDPILFGVFLDRNRQAINERFYYIGDWVDDYCDLTLDKMVSEMASKTKKNILHNVLVPSNKDELIAQLNDLQIQEEDYEDSTKLTLISSDIDLSANKKKKKSLFHKIKTFLGEKDD